MEIGRLDGILLLAVFAIFLYWMVRSAVKARKRQTNVQGVSADGTDEPIRELSALRCIIYIAGGLTAIVLGGNWVVDSASVIAESFGMSQNLIGLTVVAFGTSLPELVTSFAAAKKSQSDMALGNVIGSNIFNILLILGLSAAISPMAFHMENAIDTALLILMSIEVYFFSRKDHDIRRQEGILMLAEYAAYMVYICLR